MVTCGHVYFLRLAVAAKGKLLVPAFVAADGRVRFFTINTNRTEFQEKNPELAKHVLPLAKKDNKEFLTHDSWLCCDELVGGWTVPEIAAEKDCNRGPLDSATTAKVRQVIEESRLLSEADKAAILKSWPIEEK